MHVKEIMSTHLRTCPADAGLQEVAAKMVDGDCGAIPVVEGSRIIGVITDRDIVCRAVRMGKNPLELKARDCMTDSCVTINADASIEECLRLMETNQIRRIPVVDAQGACCGMVAQADVANHVGAYETSELIKGVSAPR